MEAMVPIWLDLSPNDQGISGNVWAWAGVRSHLLSVALEHMCPMQLNLVWMQLHGHVPVQRRQQVGSF